MEKPLFTVVIPTYNHAAFIGRCLDSIVGQSYPHWQAVVVNNYSTDNTIDIVESYHDPRIELINNHNEGIIAVSRNKGIEAAKGEWICFLDSDDWWTPNKLEACLPYLDNYDMLYHNMSVFDQEQGLQKHELIRCRTPKSPVFEDLLRLGNCCPNSSVVLRRSVVDQVGVLSEERSLVAVEDFDYWLRVGRVTERFFHIKQTLGYYWVGETSISACDKWFARHKALYAKYLPMVACPKKRRQIVLWQNYRTALEYDKYGQYRLARTYYKQAIGVHRLRSNVKMIYLLIKHTLKKQ